MVGPEVDDFGPSRTEHDSLAADVDRLSAEVRELRGLLEQSGALPCGRRCGGRAQFRNPGLAPEEGVPT